jgi:hypothetical protein
VLRIRIRILPSSSKSNKKNLDSYCFVTSWWLLSLKIYASKSNKKKKFREKKNNYLVVILKVTGENSRIMIWIRIRGADPGIRIRTKMSRIRNTGQDYTSLLLLSPWGSGDTRTWARADWSSWSASGRSSEFLNTALQRSKNITAQKIAHVFNT